MSDLIDRQAAIDSIINRTVTVDTDAQWLSGHARCELEIIDIINALPSVQQEGCPYYIENKHDRGDDSLCRLFHSEVKSLAVGTRQVGQWIDDNCSVCGFCVHHGDARNYCPNCGAKMEVDHET